MTIQKINDKWFITILENRGPEELKEPAFINALNDVEDLQGDSANIVVRLDEVNRKVEHFHRIQGEEISAFINKREPIKFKVSLYDLEYYDMQSLYLEQMLEQLNFPEHYIESIGCDLPEQGESFDEWMKRITKNGS